jgi:hypothetical protein
MTVGVVRADGHECDGRAAGGEEPGVGVGAAVVRHLEDIGGQVRAVGHDPRLRLGAEVAGEQHPHAPQGRPQHQAQVVRLSPRGRPLGLGCQHLEPGLAHLTSLARGQHDVLSAGSRQDLFQVRYPVVGGRQRSGGHLPDLPAGQRPGQPADVVGVQVREEHERQPAHAEAVQAAGDERAVRSGVDQHRLAGAGRQHQRVALAHVAGHDHGVGQRPAPADLTQRPAQRHHPDHRREGERTQPWPAQQRPRAAGQQQREQDRARGARRPTRGAVRYRGGPLGDRDQPAHRPAGEPGEDVGGTGREG